MYLTRMVLWSSALLSAAMTYASPPQNIYELAPSEWQTKWDTMGFMEPDSFHDQLFSNDTVSIQAVGEICARLQGCAGRAAQDAVAYAAVAAGVTLQSCASAANFATQRLTENNYALAWTIAHFTVVELFIPTFITGPGGNYFFNMYAQNDAPTSKTDTCGISQVQAIAEQAGTVTYGFCLELQRITQDKAFSRFDFGTIDADTTSDDLHLDMKMRMFIAREKGMHDKACSLQGVWLKE